MGSLVKVNVSVVPRGFPIISEDSAPKSAQQKGREITLEGKINAAWIKRATLDLLKAKADVAGTQMTLTY